MDNCGEYWGGYFDLLGYACESRLNRKKPFAVLVTEQVDSTWSPAPCGRWENSDSTPMASFGKISDESGLR